MESTSIVPVTIEDEMRGSYMSYAMSVIIGRALPDVRDGLKPVHRRILYAMLGEGLTSGKRYSKCAGVVGEVLKRLHPHGDAAVYDALVRMAQPWNMRYPLIDGQGNFGSIDGDPAAAYRYTECRMHALSEELLSDIDKETVDFAPNFDGSSEEPVVLPSRVPHLIVNGAEGIAVGMASKIPPHNLGEIIAATIKLVENPDTTADELMELVPGPDFPTGGIIYGSAPLREAYRSGRGQIKLRAKIHVEAIKGGKGEAIVVDEVPYQTNKARLVEKIAELVNDKKLQGISKLRDESDRRGMRVVIELKRDAVTDVVINQLFKLTPLERTFGIYMLAIVSGIPRVLGLKEILGEFIEHRRTVVTRRTRFDLARARARLHILEGFRIALDNIDKIIQAIRASDSTAEAREALQAKFGLSEIQAQHILDMPLRKLTGLERKAIEDEHQEVSERISYLSKLLSNRAEIDKVIVHELKVITEKFSDARRTVIEERGDEIADEDMIAEADMVVSISHRGYAKRCSPMVYRSQRRGGKGVMGTKKLAEGDDDFVTRLYVASTHAYLLVFTTKGKLHWLKVYELTEASRTARGRAIVNMLRLAPDERVSEILPVRHFVEGKYVVMISRRGYIKRVDVMAFANVRSGGIIATTLDDDDDLIGALLTEGQSDLIISSRDGMAIRFAETDVRVMGRNARGVRAITLDEGDQVINAVAVHAEALQPAEGQAVDAERQPALLTVCERGYGKRTLIGEYRCQGRGGKGVIDIKTAERNGPVVGTSIVSPDDDVMVITTGGKVIRMNVGTISTIGRNTMGVSLVKLDEGETVGAVARVAEGSEDDEGLELPEGEGEETPGEQGEEDEKPLVNGHGSTVEPDDE